jgi:hypothetical protein
VSWWGGETAFAGPVMYTGSNAFTAPTPAVWCWCGRVVAYGVTSLSCGPDCKPPAMAKASLWWRTVDAVDEWAHRHGLGKIASRNGRMIYPWYWRLTPFPLLCDLRDSRLLGEPLSKIRSGGDLAGDHRSGR